MWRSTFRPSAMNFVRKIASRYSSTRTLPVAPRRFPSTGFTTISSSDLIEEEKWPWYTPQSFYPVRIGDVLHSRYQVLFKLDYGTTSTIWICRDLSRDEFVCMKSMVSDYSSVDRELCAFKALSSVSTTSKAAGKSYVRHALDQFDLDHQGRTFHFLIHEPLGFPLSLLHELVQYKMPFAQALITVSEMLQAIDYLHNDVHLIHGDVQARNILLRIHDLDVLKDMEESELVEPSDRKITEETAVFVSRKAPGPIRRWFGPRSTSVLCDFGEARLGNSSHTGLIQPAPYRAPEVLLDIPWREPVDIWNLGCMTWHLMFGRQLFPRVARTDSEDDESDADANHLARIVALLGPPPAELVRESGNRALEFFNEDGSLRGQVPEISFESLLEENLDRLNSTLNRERFLRFMRRSLTWTAERRATVTELIDKFEDWIEVQSN